MHTGLLRCERLHFPVTGDDICFGVLRPSYLTMNATRDNSGDGGGGGKWLIF